MDGEDGLIFKKKYWGGERVISFVLLVYVG